MASAWGGSTTALSASERVLPGLPTTLRAPLRAHVGDGATARGSATGVNRFWIGEESGIGMSVFAGRTAAVAQVFLLVRCPPAPQPVMLPATGAALRCREEGGACCGFSLARHYLGASRVRWQGIGDDLALALGAPSERQRGHGSGLRPGRTRLTRTRCHTSETRRRDRR